MPSYLQWIRQQAGPQKLPLVFTTACIVNKTGKILWQRRRDSGLWGLPGGLLELNESLPECVSREVEEETGLKTTPTRLIGVYSSPDYDTKHPNGDQAQQIFVCFACTVNNGLPISEATLQVSNEETLELGWFSPEQPPETSLWYQLMVKDLVSNQKEVSFKHGSQGVRQTKQPFFRKIRRYIAQARFIMPAAAALVKNKNGDVLLQRRTDTGKWGIPGGAVELGERIDLTAINEVYEETGLHVEPIRLLGVYSNKNYAVTYPNGDKVKIISFFFECKIIGGQLKADGVESLEVAFFSPDNLPPLDTRQLKRLQDGLNYKEPIF